MTQIDTSPEAVARQVKELRRLSDILSRNSMGLKGSNEAKIADLVEALAAELAAAHADIDTLRDAAKEEMERAEVAEAELAKLRAGITDA